MTRTRRTRSNVRHAYTAGSWLFSAHNYIDYIADSSFNFIRSLKPFPLCTNRGSCTYTSMYVCWIAHRTQEDRIACDAYVRLFRSHWPCQGFEFLRSFFWLWTCVRLHTQKKNGRIQIDVFSTQWIDKGVSFCACVSVFYRNLQCSTHHLCILVCYFRQNIFISLTTDASCGVSFFISFGIRMYSSEC